MICGAFYEQLETIGTAVRRNVQAVIQQREARIVNASVTMPTSNDAVQVSVVQV